MKPYLLGVLGIFFVLSASCIFSASMWYKFDESWATDGNATLKVFVDTETDGSANTGVSVTVDLIIGQNKCTYTATSAAYPDGTYANFNLDLNCKGVIDVNGADLNIVMTTTSLALSKDFQFYLPGFRDVDLNWAVGDLTPNIDITTDKNIVVKPIYYDIAGNVIPDFTGQWKLYLFGPTGKFIKAYEVNGNNNVTIPVSDFNTTPGMYKLLVGNINEDENTAGYKTFVFNVKSFNLISYIQNTEDESKGTYGTGEKLELVVFATDVNNTGINLSKIYYKVDAASSYTTITSPSKKNVISLGLLGVGKHSVKVIGTYGDYNQTMNLDFYVTQYAPEFKLKKNSNAGTKEKFSGVYAPGGTVTFLFGVTDLATGVPENINTAAACASLLDGLKYMELGKKSETTVSWTDNNVSYNSTEKLCQVDVIAPSAEGEYLYKLDLNDNYSSSYSSVGLDSKILKLTVQKYVLFLEPINVESAITANGQIDKKAYKFEFFDENIGFVVNAIDLSNGSTTDLNVESVVSLTVTKSGDSKELSANDYDYNANLKLIQINKTASALKDISGKFEIKGVFDTNSDKGELITAYGSASKKTFKVYVDLNQDAYFGPPYVTPDENVVFQIRVENSSGQAVPYAIVSLASIYDIDNMQNKDLGNYSTITDMSGVAYLNIGSDLNTGTYEITLDINDGTNVDEAKGFFMIKNFFAFGFPGDYQQDGNFFENAYLGTDENIDIATFVFSGEGAGFGKTTFADTNTYNIPAGTAKLYYETNDSAGIKLIYADIVDLNKDVNWKKGDIVDPGRMVRITPDVSLTPGYYRAVYDVNWNGTIDTAVAPFVIQGFRVQVCNYTHKSVHCGESLMHGRPDVVGAPDSNIKWVLNGKSDGNIYLTVSLVDVKTNQIVPGAEDLDFYVNGVQKNDIPFDVNSNAWQTLDQNIEVYIPAGLDLGDYEMRFDFNKANVHTVYSRVMMLRNFSVAVISDNSGKRELRYIEDWQNGGFDSNILDTPLGIKSKICGDNNFDVGNIEYDYFYYPGPDSDFNYSMLADIDAQRVYIDLDKDCNFVDDNFSITPDDKSIISALTDADGNAPMITNVTLTGIRYIKVVGDIADAKAQRHNWAGEFDVDRNIVIPLNISDVSENFLKDVQVTVDKVKKIDFLTGKMETLSSGYTVYNDNNTDEYGLIFLKMNIAKPGDYQLELTVRDKSGKEERLMPWEGPVFRLKKFSSKLGFVRKERYNEINLTVDINIPPKDYNLFEKTDYEYIGLFNEQARDYDLDGDGSKDKTYYFIKNLSNGQYQIDDDFNFEEWESEAVGMKQTDIFINWVTYLGDYNSSTHHNACNTDGISVANVKTSSIRVNLLDHLGQNWDFEDYNEDTKAPIGWFSHEDPKTPDTYFITTDANTRPGSSGHRAMLFDGNVEPQLVRPIYLYKHQNEDFNFNFWAFANAADVNLKVIAFYLPNGPPKDGNVFYNFTAGRWDVNIPDLNADYFHTVVLGTDWNYFSVDINTGPMRAINLGFVGDFNSDHNYIVDDVGFDGNLTKSTVDFYNKTSYRKLPQKIIANSDANPANYYIWADSNLEALGSPNHYYEVSFADRSGQALNITDANVNALLIKKKTCTKTFTNKDMTLKGKYSGKRIGNTNSWVFDFGDLGAGIGDTNCLKYEVKVDIEALVGALKYKDSTWSSFYINNNEGS